MLLRGKIEEFKRKDNEFIFRFAASEVPDHIQINSRKIYDFSLEEYEPEKTLEQNRFMWSLIRIMAQLLHTRPNEVYEHEIQEYALDAHERTIEVPAEVDMNSIKGHWRLYKDHGDTKEYYRLKGTSEFTKKEMQAFLERVIEDAEEQGVTILPEYRRD